MGPSLHAHGGMQKNVWPTCSGGRNTEGWAHRGELGDQPGRWSFQSFSVRCDYHLEHSRRTVSKEWEDSIFVLQMLIQDQKIPPIPCLYLWYTFIIGH